MRIQPGEAKAQRERLTLRNDHMIGRWQREQRDGREERQDRQDLRREQSHGGAYR